MTNVSQHQIKTVIHNKPTILTGLNPKVSEQVWVLQESPVRGASPADRMGLKRNKSEMWNTVSPMLFSWEVGLQGFAMEQWVKEGGKSEGHPVMGWTEGEPQGDMTSRDKRADFYQGLLSRENRQSHHRKKSK